MQIFIGNNKITICSFTFQKYTQLHNTGHMHKKRTHKHKL